MDSLRILQDPMTTLTMTMMDPRGQLSRLNEEFDHSDQFNRTSLLCGRIAGGKELAVLIKLGLGGYGRSGGLGLGESPP